MLTNPLPLLAPDPGEKGAGAVDHDGLGIERKMPASTAETDRRARLALMGRVWLAPRPSRRGPVHRALGGVLLALGEGLESVGLALLRASARGR